MSKFKAVEQLMHEIQEDAKAILADIASKQVRLDKDGKIDKDPKNKPEPHDGHRAKAVEQAVANAASKFAPAAIADLSGKEKEDK